MTEGYRTVPAQRSDRLRLRSLHLGTAAMSVFLVVSTFVIFAATSTQRTLVRCADGTCTFHRLGHFTSKTERVAIRSIRGTEVTEGPHPRLMIITRRYEDVEIASDMPVETLHAAADDFQHFLVTGAREHRALVEPASNKAVYAGIVLAVAFAIWSMWKLSVWLWFRIDDGELRAYRRGVLGNAVHAGTVRLAQIAEVFIGETPGLEGVSYALSIRTHDGAVLALEDGLRSQEDRERALAALKSFLERQNA